MAILVTEAGGNFSTTTWYRNEAYNLTANGTPFVLSTLRHEPMTFANAGNLRGVVLGIGSATVQAIPTDRFAYCGIQQGATVTMPIASPGVVTDATHTFTGAISGVTISNASPCVVTSAGHGFQDGHGVAFTTTGSLPTGVTAGTQYFVKRIDADTFNLSTNFDFTTLVNTSSAGSGTHSLWHERVMFTTTGTLPTGVAISTFYWVSGISGTTYNLKSTVTGSNINFTGTSSGTHTRWHQKEYSIKSTAQIVGTGQTYYYAACWFVPFLFSGTTAVTTAASGWRIIVGQSGGSGNSWYGFGNSSNEPFYLAWCDTTQAWSSGDVPVFCAPTTYDTTTQFTGTVRFTHLGTSTFVTSFAGMICSPSSLTNRGYSSSGAGNAMFSWDGSASRSLTIDGTVWVGAHAGVYVGSEDTPITYANKATITLVNPQSMAGSSVQYSGFSALTHSTNYYGGGQTFVFSGEYPTQRYATLVSDASIGQPDLVVDDASGFLANDYVYISKHNAQYATTLDATRYQISSIASNTITLTANIATNSRLTGGRVVLVERGYGVQIYCSSLSSYSYGIIGHGISNVFFKGVYARGVWNYLGYSTSYRFPDNISNYRTGGWYCGYSLCENYQITQTASCAFFSNCYATDNGGTAEHVIAVHCQGIGAWSQYVQSLGGGVLRKVGPLTLSNCFGMRCATSQFSLGTSTGRTGSSMNDNVVHNTVYGVMFGQNLTITNHYSYGATTAIYYYTSSFATLSDSTFERQTNGILYSSAGLTILRTTIDNVTLTTTSGYEFSPSSDSYYDLDIVDPDFDATDIDASFILEIVNGSEIRIVNNNSSAGSDYVYDANGIRTRCGTGLSDTTVFGSNLYSWRFESNNQPTPLEYTYVQPIGDQQNYDMLIYMWLKINSANYYAGTHRLPRLYVDYDNGTETYVEAAESTAWQMLSLPFRPTTNYPSVRISLNGYTDATGADSHFYFGQVGVLLPAGRNIDPGSLAFWASAKPLNGIASSISAADVWAVPVSQLTGAGSVGQHVAGKVLTTGKFLALK